MKLNIETVLAALPALMQLAQTAPAVVQLVKELVDSFDANADDQDAIKQEIARLTIENDEGHIRLQQKLAEAAKET